jgi:hypothetical protein
LLAAARAWILSLMLRPALWLLLAAPAGHTPAQELVDLHLAEDLTRRGLVFVEHGGGRDTFVVGESFELTLVLALERAFLEEKLIQLFQRKLDLPVQVQAPWLAALEGAELGAFPEVADGVRLALGEELVRARRLPDETREGRAFARFELARPCRATRVGALLLAAPVVRLAYAETFADDFLEGRVPRDRHDALVHGTPRALTILPPPEEGRPPDFSGAIGSFTLTQAAPTSATVGEAFELWLEVAGQGDLSDALAPRLEGLVGFHVLGELVEREPGRLRARYDLVAERAGELPLPAQRYVTFDTTPPAGYRTLTSTAALLAAVESNFGPAAPLLEVEVETERNGPTRWIVGALVATVLVGLLVHRRTRA